MCPQTAGGAARDGGKRAKRCCGTRETTLRGVKRENDAAERAKRCRGTCKTVPRDVRNRAGRAKRYGGAQRKGIVTMGDVFIERMVKKKFESTDILLTVGIVVAMLVLVFAGFVVGFLMVGFPMLSLLIALGAGFGGYKLLTMRMLEYEYSLTNGFIAVDKIMNRSTRKRMTSFECDTCEDLGVYTQNEERLKTRSFDARVFATRYSDHRDSWYMIVRSGKTGKTLVVFDPDEDLQEAIKRFIPRQLKFEKFGRN